MMRWIFVSILLLFLALLIGWRIQQKQAQVAQQADMQKKRFGAAPSVQFAPVSLSTIDNTFMATGTVEAPLDVKLAPQITGPVHYLQVKEGDRVRKGQVLVRIDPTEVEATVRQQQAAVAEAQYRLAQAQLNQTPTDTAVHTQIRQQEAEVASAKADYEQVQQNYQAQLAAAAASLIDAQGKIDNASAAVANAQSAINSAQANLDNATTKYNRVLDLYKQGYIAAQDVDDAKTTVSVQQSAVAVAQGQLRAATAQRDSVVAQKQSAEQQASIVKTKGKADIEASHSQLLKAQASLEYAKANSVQTPAYQQSLSALREGVKAAQASLAVAQSRRADTVLIAPMEGVVTDRFLDPGGMAVSGQPILTIQFLHQVWATVAVPEAVYVKLHVGQPTKVEFDSLPNEAFTASIIQLNPAANLTSRQFTVRVLLDNAQNRFKPGMFARVTFITEHAEKALAVPLEAIQNDKSGETFVNVVNSQNIIEHRTVVTGISDANQIAILTGVKPGEKVVTMSSFPVRDGQEVKIGEGGPGKGGKGGGRGGRGPGGSGGPSSQPGVGDAGQSQPGVGAPGGGPTLPADGKQQRKWKDGAGGTPGQPATGRGPRKPGQGGGTE
jgi:HlyD family secretion protein